ncbi:MAG: 16S rRNA (cytosine(1402)-N(4))-methyltransferase RsmH, partial [Actinobacteria bacterium]|nr:16S rRNA (cytosine(1402)-N(4))-methyltransferase RsmH [Actinomycetota bacterium]
MHHSVLLQQAIEALNIKSGLLYIDATFGEGGHSIEILKHGGKVLAIDWDKNQINNFILRQPKFNSEIKFVQGNFANIETIAKENYFNPVDGILFDLGLSMFQITNSNKGFSYKMENEILDMRIDQTSSLKASDVIQDYDQDQLYEIFSRYGEDINSQKIANTIVKMRN